jgi:pyrroline-5-carboxylate reductase
MTTPLFTGPIWLLGCGNMAGAMLAGWLDAGLDPGQVTVIRPSGREAAPGVRVLTQLPEGEVPALVLLGFKPKTLEAAAPKLAPTLDPNTILVSILAGVEQATLRARFAAPRTIVKAMPNLPVRLRMGVTNLYSDAPETEARAAVTRLVAALGHAEWFDEEPLFQAAGILSGAGPAFLYRFIDALAAAGEAAGLPADQSARLALYMVRGAAALAASSDADPAELARRVASPGGTTEAGLKVLDEDGALRTLLRRTVAAGRARSLEMAAEARRAGNAPAS